jgi:hypothetical protein
MTLTDLVPSIEVCRQLKAAGFPQDMAMVWIQDGKNHARLVIIEPSVYGAYKSRIICAAPTAEGILKELPPYLQGSCCQLDLDVSHVVSCNFDGVQQEPLWIVQWCCAEIDETTGRQESSSSLVSAAAAAYLWWRKERP